MKSLFFCGIFAAIAVAAWGCTTTRPAQVVGETPQCAEYRAMMTAPMPPSAHERLRLACEASQKAPGL